MTNSSQRRALVLQRSFSPFGNKLIQSGLVDGEQMQQALAESRRSGRALTDVLESLTGQQLSPELVRQYKKQQLFELKILYGIESVDPELDALSSNQDDGESTQYKNGSNSEAGGYDWQKCVHAQDDSNCWKNLSKENKPTTTTEAPSLAPTHHVVPTIHPHKNEEKNHGNAIWHTIPHCRFAIK